MPSKLYLVACIDKRAKSVIPVNSNSMNWIALVLQSLPGVLPE